MDPNQILTTKLYPPPVTPDLVPRRQLLDRLNREGHRPLTLISAPAGYGKSVLASMWLQESDRPYGWVSLDDSDNDLHTFLAYLLAAILSAVPDASLKQSQALLELPDLPAVHIVARYLLNDLARIEEIFFLALDDIHVIHEFAIFELLTALLQHPAPTLLLLIIGRRDPPLPLASLRAYGHISEIRMHDLRFTALETGQFLKAALNQEISDAVAAAWTEKTEGWAVALQLAAISISNRGKTVWPGITVQGKNQYLQEYLVAEVLARVSPTKQLCLLKISLLDRFCGPLCEAVCQELDGDASEKGLTGESFMQWLRQRNLFLIALDDDNEWFRFHHLFQSYLRKLLERRLHPQEIATVHLRASRWLADNGKNEEAIRHALQAGDTDAAISYFNQCRYQFMNHEQWSALDQLFKLFPEDLVRSDPVLAITRAYTTFFTSRLRMTVAHLKAAKESAASLPADSSLKTVVSGEIAILVGTMGIVRGESGTSILAVVEGAVKTLPTQAFYAHGVAVGTQAVAYQMAGEWQQASLITREAAANSHLPATTQASILFYYCIASFMEGALDQIPRSASRSLQLVQENPLWAQKGWREYFLAITFYLRNDLVASESYLTEIIENPAAIPAYLAFAACALARLFQSQQRIDKAARILEAAMTHLEDIGAVAVLDTLRAFQVELALDQDNLSEAQQLSWAVDFHARPMLWFHFIPQLTPIKLLLRQGGQNDLEQAQMQLDAIEDHVRSINRKTILIDVLALQALVYYAQGNRQTAYEKLHESLLLAEPGGFIRNYVDLGPATADLIRDYQDQQTESMEQSSYVASILAAFPRAASDSADIDNSPAAPQLTRREMEILELLATDLSTNEIADKMFISVATARTHIRNIYAKLDAHGRYEAVQNAQETSLL